MEAAESKLVIEKGSDFLVRFQATEGIGNGQNINGAVPYFRLMTVGDPDNLVGGTRGDRDDSYGDDNIYTVSTDGTTIGYTEGLHTSGGLNDGVVLENKLDTVTILTGMTDADTATLTGLISGVTVVTAALVTSVGNSGVANAAQVVEMLERVLGQDLTTDGTSGITVELGITVVTDDNTIKLIGKIPGGEGWFKIAVDGNVTELLETLVDSDTKNKFATEFQYYYHIGLNNLDDDGVKRSVRYLRGKCSVRA